VPRHMCEHSLNHPNNISTNSAPPLLSANTMAPDGTVRAKLTAAATLPNALGFVFGCVSMAALDVWKAEDNEGIAALFDYVIPGGALCALFVALALGVRSAIQFSEERCFKASHLPRFGRKGMLILSTSILIVSSCVYRSIFIASEGAALCRGSPSVFNAPFSGRMVATVGEMALVAQVTAYLEAAAQRLSVHNHTWASCQRVAFALVTMAEVMSWTGVMTANARFFCVEYILWCLIAVTWAWDAAELVHKSTRWGDLLAHTGVLLGSVGLFLFNACCEIPHFFHNYERVASGSVESTPSLWTCMQDETSPIWVKRLPFFFCYFFGASWCSVALSYRHVCAIEEKMVHRRLVNAGMQTRGALKEA